MDENITNELLLNINEVEEKLSKLLSSTLDNNVLKKLLIFYNDLLLLKNKVYHYKRENNHKISKDLLISKYKEYKDLMTNL